MIPLPTDDQKHVGCDPQLFPLCNSRIAVQDSKLSSAGFHKKTTKFLQLIGFD